MKPCLENSQHKEADRVVQVIEYPPSKYEALSSNPSTAKKIKNKNKNMKV
jgi:hypothetical protein